jgi:hypothetical protein
MSTEFLINLEYVGSHVAKVIPNNLPLNLL